MKKTFLWIDIAGLASFIVYDSFQPSRKSDKRRMFLNLLATELVTPHMENRTMNSHVSRWPGISAAMAKFNVVVSNLKSMNKIISISNYTVIFAGTIE